MRAVLNIIKSAGRLMVVIVLFVTVALATVLALSSGSFAAEQQSEIPEWLKSNIGEGDGQIVPVVLQRARALYVQKVHAGKIRNPCYLAMDATRPHDLGGGKVGPRFYVVCEASQSFRAFSAGHGGGRDLKGIADFANGKRCAKNFGNALIFPDDRRGLCHRRDQNVIQRLLPNAANRDAALIRSFVQFDGEGETANARVREIGGHAAALLRNVCLRKDPHSAYADQDGYVPFGELEEYANGRSDGCTSWSRPDAGQIVAVIKDNPTTLYIYPEESRHRRGRAGGEGRPAVAGRRTLLERVLFERNRRAEILGGKKPLSRCWPNTKRLIRRRRKPRRRFAGGSGHCLLFLANVVLLPLPRAGRGECIN